MRHRRRSCRRLGDLGDFGGDASFKTWVVAIAWRRALSHRRNIVRRLRLFGEPRETAFGEPAAHAPSAEEALIADELGNAVKRLIRSLPLRLRDPLLLAATGQHSYREIAAILGIPEGTLKWRISEARRVLKDKLTNLGYSND